MSVTFSHYTMKPISTKEMDNTRISSIIPNINDVIKITDSRLLKDFKDQVFGGYKLSQAIHALEKAILEDKLEPGLHWASQIFLSGPMNSLWQKLISIAYKNINIYNPYLPEFIFNKSKQWVHIVDNIKYQKDNILQLRNHPTIRLLLAEMVAVLVLSKKRKIVQLPRIKKEEFLIDNFRSKLVAKDNRLIDGITQDGDPSEIKIAINEMAYHIYSNNVNKSLFWFNWIMEWEKINSKKYGKYECASRPLQGIDAKYHRDVIWLIWAVINKLRELKLEIISSSLNNQINYLWKLYLDKFTPAHRSRKQNIIIWAILCIADSNSIDMNIPLIDRPQLLFQSLLGFDKIIMTLKSQEVHSVVRNDLVNVVVENNYMLPENHKQLEEARLQQIKQQELLKKEQLAIQLSKQSQKVNINTDSMRKLNDIYKLDRMMYS